MGGIRPIPKKILRHTVKYSGYEGTGTFGEKFSNPIDVRHVRVEPTNKVVKDNNKNEIVASAVLFVDYRNSSHHDFKPKSKVEFGGLEMRVITVDTLYGLSDTPHHWEVYLQ